MSKYIYKYIYNIITNQTNICLLAFVVFKKKKYLLAFVHIIIIGVIVTTNDTITGLLLFRTNECIVLTTPNLIIKYITIAIINAWFMGLFKILKLRLCINARIQNNKNKDTTSTGSQLQKPPQLSS